jgi:hypothetical protein
MRLDDCLQIQILKKVIPKTPQGSPSGLKQTSDEEKAKPIAETGEGAEYGENAP